MVPGLGTCSTRPRGNNMIWPKNNINSTTLYMICVAITLNVAWYLRCIFLHRSLSCPQRQATDFEQEYVINIQGNNPPPPTYLLNLCVFLLPSEENKNLRAWESWGGSSEEMEIKGRTCVTRYKHLTFIISVVIPPRHWLVRQQRCQYENGVRCKKRAGNPCP